MYIKREQFLVDAQGNVTFTVETDSQEIVDDVERERDETGGWSHGRTMKKMCAIPPHIYNDMVNRFGVECWSDKDFLKHMEKTRPEFFI